MFRRESRSYGRSHKDFDLETRSETQRNQFNDVLGFGEVAIVFTSEEAKASLELTTLLLQLRIQERLQAPQLIAMGSTRWPETHRAVLLDRSLQAQVRRQNWCGVV